MPIKKSAKKALRQSKKRAQRNLKGRRQMRDVLKTIQKGLTSPKEEQQKALPAAYKALDKAAKWGIIKKNTASRIKSRITKRVSRAGQ
ncbi:MAG: 30S ribosomal protein S20 [Candidatus Yanofskybacteria bacterium]|nr:30S ribosomal protein S20 [Candidatus Yanofskybacteria bacterium]